MPCHYGEVFYRACTVTQRRISVELSCSSSESNVQASMKATNSLVAEAIGQALPEPWKEFLNRVSERSIDFSIDTDLSNLQGRTALVTGGQEKPISSFVQSVCEKSFSLTLPI